MLQLDQVGINFVSMIFDNIFKNKIPVFEKLANFGFVLYEDIYVYSCKIVDGQFIFNVRVDPSGKIQTKVIDSTTKDEYILHLIEGTTGNFIGKVRTQCFNVLQKVADNCFETKVFHSAYANEVIRYVKEKYQHDPEYLWSKFPENAIIRRSDNKKWYAVLLIVERHKIGLTGNKKTEIIDLRVKPEELKEIIDGKKYFSGFHMNKKHWMTLCLDGSVDLQEIFNRIDDSYLLANK